MYLNRQIETQFKKIINEYSCVVLTGARQVGKSTLISINKPNDMKYVTLDDIDLLYLATTDPKYFLEFHGTPLCIDEIQKAPILLNYIKIKIDEHKLECMKNNNENELLYILTGSQQFSMMKEVSESLAGRVGILNLFSLSQNEIHKEKRNLFIPAIEYFKQNKLNKRDTREIFNRIFEGGMPDYIINNISRETFFSSYLETYINKDIRNYLNIGKSMEFYNFMQYIAVRTSCEVDYTSISRAIGVDSNTIKKWISILESSGIIYLLQPYSSNISNRLIKRPKMYFMDTGLCTYLAKWPNSETLEVGAMSGSIFETFIVSEIIKNYYNNGVNPKDYLFYYRDKDQYEIDLLYVDSNSITPIEIKKSISPSNPNKNFKVLNKFNLEVKQGIVLCMTEELIPFNKECLLVSVNLI
ncbi:MAG: DUF4143 domain-containing protein [bacterium]